MVEKVLIHLTKIKVLKQRGAAEASYNQNALNSTASNVKISASKNF